MEKIEGNLPSVDEPLSPTSLGESVRELRKDVNQAIEDLNQVRDDLDVRFGRDGTRLQTLEQESKMDREQDLAQAMVVEGRRSPDEKEEEDHR